MKDTEIEIKVKVEDARLLVEYLDERATFRGEHRQVDEYFTPAHRDFLAARPAIEWLRLRDADGKSSINYKHWYADTEGKMNHCDEYETQVGSVELVRKIFTALNFRSLVIVDKVRRSWQYRNYEVSIDSVKGLGDFIEVEYKAQAEEPATADPKAITDEMVRWLKNFKCGRVQRNYQGYPFLLLFPNEAKWEEV